LLSSTFSSTAPAPLSRRPSAGRRDAAARRRHEAAQHHHGQTPRDGATLAETPADETAGQRERDAGRQIEADERAQLRVREPQVLHHQRPDGRQRLELHAHRQAREDDQRERDPAVRHRHGDDTRVL
jgi:hypothetical protein